MQKPCVLRLRHTFDVSGILCGEAAVRAVIVGVARAMEPRITPARLWALLVAAPPVARGSWWEHSIALPNPLRVRLCVHRTTDAFAQDDGALMARAVDPAFRQGLGTALYTGDLVVGLSGEGRWALAHAFCPDNGGGLFVRATEQEKENDDEDDEDGDGEEPLRVTVHFPALLHPSIQRTRDAAAPPAVALQARTQRMVGSLLNKGRALLESL